MCLPTAGPLATQEIADFDQIAVRVSEIDGQDPSGGAVAFGWARHSGDPQLSKRRGDALDGLLCVRVQCRGQCLVRLLRPGD